MNQKCTDFRRLIASEISPGDLVPIVDVDAITTPTGENKTTTAWDLAQYVATTGLILPSLISSAPSNGLAFDGNYNPVSNRNNFCYCQFPSIGTGDVTISTHLFLSSDHPQNYNADIERVLVGLGESVSTTLNGNNALYLAIEGNDLVGYCKTSTMTNATRIRATDILLQSMDKFLNVLLVRTSVGNLSMWINGALIPTVTDLYAESVTGAINNSVLVVGNGGTNITNTDVTVYSLAVFNVPVTTQERAVKLFYRGTQSDDTTLMGYWAGSQLYQKSTLWMDMSGNGRNLLLPVSGGSTPTNPSRHFSLTFYTSASGFLGNGDSRAVLPERYTLSSCVMESAGKPLISVGTSATPTFVGASITGSWNDNRVSIVSASFGVNPLTLLTLGDVHTERSIYVQFYSGSDTPCTFSFEGYTR